MVKRTVASLQVNRRHVYVSRSVPDGTMGMAKPSYIIKCGQKHVLNYSIAIAGIYEG
jgi:hypothetical protein